MVITLIWWSTVYLVYCFQRRKNYQEYQTPITVAPVSHVKSVHPLAVSTPLHSVNTNETHLQASHKSEMLKSSRQKQGLTTEQHKTDVSVSSSHSYPIENCSVDPKMTVENVTTLTVNTGTSRVVQNQQVILAWPMCYLCMKFTNSDLSIPYIALTFTIFFFNVTVARQSEIKVEATQIIASLTIFHGCCREQLIRC